MKGKQIYFRQRLQHNKRLRLGVKFITFNKPIGFPNTYESLQVAQEDEQTHRHDMMIRVAMMKRTYQFCHRRGLHLRCVSHSLI